MALGHCDDCGHAVSDRARACPRCGCPVGSALRGAGTSPHVYYDEPPIFVSSGIIRSGTETYSLHHLSSISMRSHSVGNDGLRRGALMSLVLAVAVSVLSLAGSAFLVLSSVAMAIASLFGQEHELILTGAGGEMIAYTTRNGQRAEQLAQAISSAISEKPR